MAKMTLERAEKILKKSRQPYTGLTDNEIARKQHHRACSNAAVTLAIFAIGQMRFAVNRHWDLMPTLAIALTLVGLAAYLIIKATRYDMIRELFENAAPQNLADLRSSSLDKP